MTPSRYIRPTFSTFDDFLADFFDVPAKRASGTKTPKHDVIENDKEFIVEMVLAGVSKEDIKIDVEKDVLTIKAERKEVKDLNYNRKETYFGKYERMFVLPEDVDKDNIDASLTDGILKVIVPKLVGDIKVGKKAIEIK